MSSNPGDSHLHGWVGAHMTNDKWRKWLRLLHVFFYLLATNTDVLQHRCNRQSTTDGVNDICMGGWVHTWPKYSRFRCFHQSAWIDLRQTFSQYKGVSLLYNERYWLRRLAQRTRFVARVVENWHTPSLICALAFNNRWVYRNSQCRLLRYDDSSTSGKNLVNFSPITPEILLLICMGGWVFTWPKCAMRWFLKVIPVTHYEIFGASIISLERLNLKSSNFVHIGYITSSNRMTYHPQKGHGYSQVTVLKFCRLPWCNASRGFFSEIWAFTNAWKIFTVTIPEMRVSYGGPTTFVLVKLLACYA